MTKTQNLINELKTELLECFSDDKKESLNEIVRYVNEFYLETDFNIYMYGNIRPYYYQIRAFFDACKMKVSKNDDVMLARYKYYIRQAVNEILKENNISIDLRKARGFNLSMYR